jgi:DNA invertase Pin-like site-specific DNA recombinase
VSKFAVIYCRVSPRPEENESLEVQEGACLVWCLREGYEVIAVESDNLKSGGSLKGRDGLESALKTAVRRKAVLVAYSMSRVARSVRDAIDIVERLGSPELRSKSGLKVLDMEVDTTTAHGRMVFNMMTAFDQYFREKGAENTSNAMHHHQNGGRMQSYRLPYGWELDPDRERETKVTRDGKGVRPIYMRQNVVEQKNIQLVTRLRNAGASMRGVATFLNRWQVPCRGHTWHHTLIRRILGRVDEASDAA